MIPLDFLEFVRVLFTVYRYGSSSLSLLVITSNSWHILLQELGKQVPGIFVRQHIPFGSTGFQAGNTFSTKVLLIVPDLQFKEFCDLGEFSIILIHSPAKSSRSALREKEMDFQYNSGSLYTVAKHNQTAYFVP